MFILPHRGFEFQHKRRLKGFEPSPPDAFEAIFVFSSHLFHKSPAEKTTVEAVIKINAERLLIYGFEIPLGDRDAILSFCATYH